MTTPVNPDPAPLQSASPMGPPGASPFGAAPSGSQPAAPIQPPPSKNMQMWQKFLGAGATPEQVQKFQEQFLNAITKQFTKEAEKSRQKRKEDAQRMLGND